MRRFVSRFSIATAPVLFTVLLLALILCSLGFDARAQVPGLPTQVAQPVTIATCTFTRPADTTAYTSGDLVANSTSAGSVVPCNFTVARGINTAVHIRRIGLQYNDTVVTNAQFRVHLFRTCTITVANGDNGALSANQQANWIGAADITVAQTFTAAAKQFGLPNVGTEIITLPTAGARTICALVEARAAYVPTSAEVFVLTLEAVLN